MECLIGVFSMEIKVSVIIPVYNGQSYLFDTINSVLNQDFKEYEIVFVDDGSTDNSLNILRKFERPNVIIIDQPNRGICAARNAAIKVARGKYLMFCDQDDIYRSNYVKTAYKEIESLQCDFVKFGCVEYYLRKDVIVQKNEIILADAVYKNNVKNILQQYLQYNEYIWDGIYTKEIIEKVGGFDPSYLAGCEDVDLIFKIIKEADGCAARRGVFYEHYIRNTSSTSRRFSENSYESVIKIFAKRMESFSCDEEIKYREEKTIQFVWAILGMFSFTTCNLSVKEMRDRLKAIAQIPNFNLELYSSKNIGLYIISLLYKNKLYFLLAVICKIKRSMRN